MSFTLFAYVFKDLMRVFLLALLALAVIMSFGGLLRPLTRQGLDIGQVGEVLAYLVPAMTTYALPIAALFATTMVYGRLSADNEITACRAGGMSHGTVVMPAVLLGLLVSLLSLLLLCFVVPGLTLRVERVATSNLAKFVAYQIDRSHQIKLGDMTIFAQRAELPPGGTGNPNEQMVTLVAPLVVQYQRTADVATTRPAARNATGTATDEEDDDAQKVKDVIADIRGRTPPKNASSNPPKIPERFWMAERGTAFIRMPANPNDNVTFWAQSEGGTMFERGTLTNHGGIASASFGPFPIESLVRQHPRFMDIRELKSMLADRSQSQKLKREFADMIRHDQNAEYVRDIIYTLNTTDVYKFDLGTGDRWELHRPRTVEASYAKRRDGRAYAVVQLNSPDETARAVRLLHYRGRNLDLTATANEVRVKVNADNDAKRMNVTFQMSNVDLVSGDSQTGYASLDRSISVPMPKTLSTIANKTLSAYLSGDDVPASATNKLRRQIMSVTNDLISEMHGRVSFAVSCLILVLVGACLGLMFRSGNFLSAFAVSVVPALLCIALIATGQSTMETLPAIVNAHNNPLHLGMAIIWSGNLAVAVIATALLWRLQRQ